MAGVKTLYQGKNTNRLHSPGIWSQVDMLAIMLGHKDGSYFFDDFHYGGGSLSSNHIRWAAGRGPIYYDFFGTTGVTFAPVQQSDDGKMIGECKATVDADNEEGYLSVDVTNGSPLTKCSNTAGENYRMAFECRVKFSDVASTTGMGKLIGLTDTGQAATGTITTNAASLEAASVLGFRALIADGDGMDAVFGDTSLTVAREAADNTALNAVADTYCKYGLYFDGVKMHWFINGTEIALDSAVKPSTTNFPNTDPLVPFIGVSCEGSVGTLTWTIDWLALASYEEQA